MTFATQSANVSSRSMSCVNLQRRPSIGVLVDIVRLKQLAVDGFNRIFLTTMCCGFRMVARIPYPATIPKYFDALVKWLLWPSSVPLGCLYLRHTDSTHLQAGTEHMFMEFYKAPI